MDLDKGPFAGRDALLAEQAAGIRRRIVTIALSEQGEAEAPVEAPVWQGGRRVGAVTSSAYGHALRQSLALALVESEAARQGQTVDIEMMGAMRPARIVADSPYDPSHSRLRA